MLGVGSIAQYTHCLTGGDHDRRCAPWSEHDCCCWIYQAVDP